MASLCVKPSGLPESKNRPWVLILREHDLGGTSYSHVAYLTDEQAVAVIDAGPPYWLYGEPDWEARAKAIALEKARALRQEADKIAAEHGERL